MEYATTTSRFGSGCSRAAAVAPAMRRALDHLRDHPTSCPQCGVGLASVIVGSSTTPWISCRRCSGDHLRANPNERRRMQLECAVRR